MKERGFTIIELLVVVAIIAVLASVVIISIDAYRGRSANANIQATLGQIRAEAALYQEATGSFAGLCNAGDPHRIAAQFAEAQVQSFNQGKCHSDADSWVVAVPLRAGSDYFAWCVDSNNHGGGIDSLRFGSIIGPNTLCSS